MRIVSWNCRGKFREKRASLTGLNADILIIPECGEADLHPFGEYTNLVYTPKQAESTHQKWLCVFAKSGIKLKEAESLAPGDFKHLLPVMVNDSFLLLAVWTVGKNYYMGNYVGFHREHAGRYPENTIVMGDFNGNPAYKTNSYDGKMWVDYFNEGNKRLNEIGLVSLYHHFTGEKMGAEKTCTFFKTKKSGPDIQYYIDYCYTRPELVRDFRVLDDDSWLALSDHLPLLLDVDIDPATE